ncbi:hypothetical protein JHK82_016250 [Glycine max]|nr:hypothetical protein JHK85_016657 [Glycine max]KAG5046881.1 hypothetical protein JHK86_016287 [Glycine max]KAG5149369.1 hypothetical protein JHK82_016250 [Glycine max]KRH55170.2 hypothetical protein GLYMA_06G234900v4 [Glycine max]
MDQCSLTATSEEQYVNIEIPEQLIRGWLVLSLHGRRGFPMTARVSLLDSSYIHYENTVIGTVLTTLHVGSVVLTIFPNYNVSLKDPTLPQRMKVQIQITRAEQVSEAHSATLHHQIIYRLQNHAVNLSLPTSHDSGLFILANNQEETPSIVQIPRNMKPDEASCNNSSEVFHSLMIKPRIKEDSKMPIFVVKADGGVIYSNKVNGHFIWDIAPAMCDSDCSCDEHDGDIDEETDDEEEDKWKLDPRPCKLPPPPQRRSNPENGPWTGIKKKYPEDPFWKEKRMAEILGWSHPSLKIPATPIPCMMLSSTSYDQEFPSLDKKTDPVTKVSTKPYIIPTEVGPEGKLKSPSQVEEVLNWQADNARAQNHFLKKIDEKIDRICTQVSTNDEKLQYLPDRMKKQYHQLSKEIARLEEEWRKTAFGVASNAKEREIRRLKAQVQDLDRYIESKIIEKQKSVLDPYSFLTPPSPTFYSPFPNPPYYFFSKASQSWSLPTTSAYKKKSEPPKKESTRLNISSQESTESPTRIGETQKNDPHDFQDSQDPYSQFSIQQKLEASEGSDETGTESEESSSETQKSYSDEEEEDGHMDISNILMARSTEEPFYDSPVEEEPVFSKSSSSKPNAGPWFILDDTPPREWRKKLIEMGAWLDTKFMKDADPYKVTEEFCCRMTGTLKEWYHNLGVVHQNQFLELGSTTAVLGTLHQEFIGEGKIIERKIRQEFFEMRCCSLKIKDLDRRFQRMNQRFYLLDGLNDPSLKNTYVASLPEEIQPELNKMVAAAQMDFSTMSMGKINQFTLEVVDKLCRQHQYFSDIMNRKVKYSRACKKPYLEIKCKEKTCHCSPKKKKALQTHTKEKRRPLKFFRRSQRRGKSRGQRCFICHQTIHFAKNCPKKSQKAIRLISHLQIDTGAQRTMMDPDILPQKYWKNEVAYFLVADGKVF